MLSACKDAQDIGDWNEKLKESVDLKAKSQQKDVRLEFDSQKVRTAKGLRFQLKTTYSGTHEFITNKDFIGMNIKLFKKGGITIK